MTEDFLPVEVLLLQLLFFLLISILLLLFFIPTVKLIIQSCIGHSNFE